MQSIRKLYAIFSLFIALFTGQTGWAHFGSKGPYGGSVTCAISYDSLVYIGTGNGGVYISSTTAISAWTARPVGLTSGRITALTHSGSYLFAGTADSGIFVFNGYVGSDRYWLKVNNGLGNLRIRSLLALDSVTVLAGTDGNGLYKTTNKGASWTWVNNTALNSAAITGMMKAGGRLFLTTESGGVFVSNDSGATWSSFNDANTLGISNTKALGYHSGADVLMVSNANGLFTLAAASTTTVAAFTSAQSGLPANTQIRDIKAAATDWYLATDKGVYTTSTGTIAWVAINNALTTLDVTAIATAQNRLIAGTNKQGLFKSTTGAYNWVNTNTGLNNSVTRTMAAGGDSLIVVATEDGIYVSTNLATSYTKRNTGLTDSLQVNDLLIAHGDLYAATTAGGVFSSEDSGATWMAMNNGLASMNIRVLFNATHHLLAIDAAGGVFESVLHSGTWEAIQDGLPSGVQPTSLAFYGGQLFLGTRGHGVFIRDLHEGDWVPAIAGLTNLNVTAVTASGNKLFAGTDGSAVFVSDIDSIVWVATAPTSIAHTTMMGLNGNRIQAMGSYAGYVYASYKGGVLATADNGATWIAGGNQFNLPSFTGIRKVCFVNTRIFVPTENNAVYSNALSELPVLNDTLLVSHDELDFESTPTEEATVSVTSNRGWSISADQPWVATSAASGFRNGDFTVAASPNSAEAPRTATITLTAGLVTRTIHITQKGFTSIGEQRARVNEVRVFPNPCEGPFTLEGTTGGLTIQQAAIYDFTGRQIAVYAPEAGASRLKAYLEAPPGIYVLVAETNQGALNLKLMMK